MQSKSLLMQALSKKITEISLLTFTIMVSVALKMLLAVTIMYIVDKVLPTPIDEESKLGIRVSIFVVIALLAFLTELSSKAQALNLGSFINTNLSNAVYSSGIRSEMNEISKIEANEISKKITDDCTKIGNFISVTWVKFWKEFILLVGLFITLITTQSLLCTITFITLPMFYMLVRALEKYTVKSYQKVNNEIMRRDEVVKENFSKLRSIKLKNGIRQEEEEFHKYNESYAKAYKQYSGLAEMTNKMIVPLFVAFVLAINLGLGGLFKINNYMATTLGELVSFLLLVPFVFTTFKSLMDSNIYFEKIEGEFASLDQILSLRSEIKSEPINSLEDVHSLKFQNVTYNSLSNEGNLDSVSFELKRGEKLGVVSFDGNGTNTIFELLTKIIRPKDGAILINNCDINKLNTFYLRDIVTAVPQEKCLFNDTIANNITYPLAFDEYKYNDALNRSGLKDILPDFEKKDETVICKDNPLSDEMMQRITLANAFYKDSKIFILNEATSSLDVRSEEAIMKEFYKLKNKIAIIMSNKVYNVINCDKVLIIDKDQVLEYGKVQELIQNKDSLFYNMIKKVKITKATKVS